MDESSFDFTPLKRIASRIDRIFPQIFMLLCLILAISLSISLYHSYDIQEKFKVICVNSVKNDTYTKFGDFYIYCEDHIPDKFSNLGQRVMTGMDPIIIPGR